MKKAFVVLGCFLVGCILFIIFTGQNIDKNNSSAIDTPQSNDTSNLMYVVKEYNGNIAVFKKDNDTPLRVTDVRLNELPYGDKKLLNKGIYVSTSNELNCVLEDYCS